MGENAAGSSAPGNVAEATGSRTGKFDLGKTVRKSSVCGNLRCRYHGDMSQSSSSVSTEPQRRRGVIGVVGQQNKLLIIRRSQWVRAPGAYCFPGGHIEPGESEEAALVREFREELHVDVRPVRRLWQNATTWRVDLTWWLAAADPDSIYVPHPPEVESFHWLTLDETAALPGLLDSNRVFLEAVRRGELSLDE